MSLEVFGDGGDVEDLIEAADKLHHCQCSDGLFREFDASGIWSTSDKGMTEQEMWEYIWDRRESDLENMLDADAAV